MTNAIEEMKEVFRESFMQPQCYIGADIEDVLMQSDMDCEADKYYCRLSASGYMDCTDWHGPFDTIEESAMCLIEIYGES